MSLTTPTAGRSRPREVYYPESDGKPMAETDAHRDSMVYFIQVLQQHFQGRAYVTGNILLYYVEGDPRRSVSPDCMVVFGAPTEQRRTYLLWKEPLPDVVIEVTSRKTRREDLGRKMELYRRLGIRELWLVDPCREYLGEPVMGYKLEQGQWRRLPFERGRGFSEAMSLEFRETETGLRLYDPDEHRLLQPLAEGLASARSLAAEERKRAEQERAAREQAQARAEQAQARAEQERAARVQAQARSDALEAEKAALLAEVDRLRRAAAE